jgi:chromosome partitioning protein
MTKKLPSFLEINAYDKNFFVIPAKINLALAQREIQGKTYRESILSKQLNRLKEIDYCVIDCSPTLSDLTVNAIYAADILLVPIAYEDDALEGLADLFTVIGEVKEHHNYEFKILRNKKDPRKSKTNIYIENKLLPFYSNGTLLRTIIRQDEQFNQAKIERKTIFHYAPHSNGAEDINKLTTELFP